MSIEAASDGEDVSRTGVLAATEGHFPLLSASSIHLVHPCVQRHHHGSETLKHVLHGRLLLPISPVRLMFRIYHVSDTFLQSLDLLGQASGHLVFRRHDLIRHSGVK